jgi:hypothetical protein
MSLPTHVIWPALPAPLGNEILVSVQKGNKKLYRTAVEVMAPRMGVRVPILIEMPKAQRHATFIRILARPEMEVLSFNLFSAWLIESQRPLLCAWLDALGIEHGENGCADTFPPEPSSELMKQGIDKLLAEFDPLLVSVYLRCFNAIDETHWPALEQILQSDIRLALRAGPKESAAATEAVPAPGVPLAVSAE